MTETQHEVDPWESGELGCSMEHARPAPPELEAEVDAALGLQKVELRLPVEVVAAFEALSAATGIGWKPLMRQALSLATHDPQAATKLAAGL